MSAARLQLRWQQLSQVLRASPSVADKWWTTVQTKYTEVQRFYHTLDHLADMFTHFDTWKQEIKNNTAVSLAIYFHDIVYEPKSSSNEQDSIVMFRDFSKEINLDQVVADTTIGLIDATVSHLTEGEDNTDLRFFLDFDMAVLGRQPDGYDEYAVQISKEYSHLGPTIYNTKRAEVLQNFLGRDHIFSTQEFQQRYEEKARSNIAREITLLHHKLEDAQK